jgi:hypothetical protein
VNREITDEVADLGAHQATHDIRKPVGMHKARRMIGTGHAHAVPAIIAM